jgi:hypothetical protein
MPVPAALARITATAGTDAIDSAVENASRSPSPLTGRSTIAQK